MERSSEAGKRKLPRLKVSHTGLYLERSIQRLIENLQDLLWRDHQRLVTGRDHQRILLFLTTDRRYLHIWKKVFLYWSWQQRDYLFWLVWFISLTYRGCVLGSVDSSHWLTGDVYWVSFSKYWLRDVYWVLLCKSLKTLMCIATVIWMIDLSITHSVNLEEICLFYAVLLINCVGKIVTESNNCGFYIFYVNFWNY